MNVTILNILRFSWILWASHISFKRVLINKLFSDTFLQETCNKRKQVGWYSEPEGGVEPWRSCLVSHLHPQFIKKTLSPSHLSTMCQCCVAFQVINNTLINQINSLVRDVVRSWGASVWIWALMGEGLYKLMLFMILTVPAPRLKALASAICLGVNRKTRYRAGWIIQAPTTHALLLFKHEL